MNTVWNAQLCTHIRVRAHTSMWAVDVLYNTMPMRTQIMSTAATATRLGRELSAHYQAPLVTPDGVRHGYVHTRKVS